MIRIREIAGRPIAHWISPKFIEDLPLDGDESFQQSLIDIVPANFHQKLECKRYEMPFSGV